MVRDAALTTLLWLDMPCFAPLLTMRDRFDRLSPETTFNRPHPEEAAVRRRSTNTDMNAAVSKGEVVHWASALI